MLEVSEIRDKNNEIFPFGIITDKLVNVELRTLKTFVKFTTYTSEDYNSFTKTNNAIITPFEFWRKNLHSVVRCILRTLSRRRFYLIKKKRITRLRELHNDGQAVDEKIRRTAVQKPIISSRCWVRLLISAMWFLEKSIAYSLFHMAGHQATLRISIK